MPNKGTRGREISLFVIPVISHITSWGLPFDITFRLYAYTALKNLVHCSDLGVLLTTKV